MATARRIIITRRRGGREAPAQNAFSLRPLQPSAPSMISLSQLHHQPPPLAVSTGLRLSPFDNPTTTPPLLHRQQRPLRSNQPPSYTTTQPLPPRSRRAAAANIGGEAAAASLRAASRRGGFRCEEAGREAGRGGPGGPADRRAGRAAGPAADRVDGVAGQGRGGAVRRRVAPRPAPVGRRRARGLRWRGPGRGRGVGPRRPGAGRGLPVLPSRAGVRGAAAVSASVSVRRVQRGHRR
ncbi:putative BOI-related E3 ubiquitin-protein ligase 1 [Iris pallida]|uniref:BOI-related E3 ubiquitin-protein ligase 1 n=1 Tax=Iris pallida TaxID=29817 RepID=A0AAX6HY15_IRIPA|nr:putative BOI-related E3 ubiquitin-protein ligase 1 [Iris pallida]